MLLASRRLPGIRFEAPAPPPAFVLPRMDVAGFVGYASAGPPDVPVPVEDAGEFADVFGDDLQLAWDAERGEPAYAALAPAVRSFFRNGGRRCYVVRVADPEARATPFEIPGHLALAGGDVAHALLRARSVGAWADAIRVGAMVTATPLIVRGVALRAGTFDVVSSAGVVGTGDMVRLRFGAWTLLATVAVASARQAPSADPEQAALLRVTAGEQLWMQPAADLPAALDRVAWAGPGGAPRSAGASPRADGRVLLRTAIERGPAPEALVRLIGGPDDMWARIVARERSADGLLLRCEAVRLRSTPPQGVQSPRGRMPAERLELELQTQSPTASRRIGGLGFAPGHPRFVGDLPADDELYAGEAPEQPELWHDARSPRFPLASPRGAVRPRAYFPVLTTLLAERSLGALPSEAAARRRDGITRFSSSAFVDERLAGVRTSALLSQADHLRYGAGLATPEPLRGLHALLGVDAVSLVAVPDAAQAGWVAEPQEDPAPPVPEPPAEEPGAGTFRACAPSALATPALEATGDAAAGTLALTWDGPPAGAEIEIEEAADSAFATATLVYRGGGDELTLGGRPDGPHWYRARFVSPSAAGPRAALGPIGSLPRARALLRRPAEYSDRVLIAVHRALVRMCAARGDLFALLALPEHYAAAAAIDHPAALRVQQTAPPPGVPALGDGETMTLAYAALHHPWLVTVSEERPGELRRVPPDGAMAGVSARRSVDRGAWVAPANVELLDVVALSRAPEAPRRGALFDAQVNVVERTPRGFMARSADTLATHPDLRPVNVRRLLQLLRRLALRHGETYVFETNGDELRRTVEHGFEAVLGALFVLGAFSGARPDEGFRVVVGSPPNTPRSRDAGQLVVELKVAPSRPLAFLTVRLVRAGDGNLVVETV